jgi:hypothetical protein
MTSPAEAIKLAKTAKKYPAGSGVPVSVKAGARCPHGDNLEEKMKAMGWHM